MDKLLFFDIDGTIFDDDRRLPDSVIPSMKEARGKGCRLFLNTGRTLCNMDRRLNTLPLDGMVTGCGSRVTCGNETLFSLEYGAEDSLKIRDIVLQSGIPAVYECDTAMYFDPEGKEHPALPRFREFAVWQGIFREIAADDPEFRAVKMFAFSEKEAPLRKMLEALGRSGYGYDPIFRGNGGWEIVPSGCSKATGIEAVRKHFGVPLEGCYAFGDSNNDLTMLDHVRFSIAMGNAPEEVRRHCLYVTEKPERDGIRKALIHFGLI